MLKNYINIALRSFRKNYLYTLINIFGMAVGLSGVILTLLLFEYETGFDDNLKNTSSLYRINSVRMFEGESQKWGVVPNALGPNIAQDVEGIESFCRYGMNHAFLVQYEDIIHRENIAFADPNFFDLFPLEVVSGHTNTFRDKNTIVISEEMAKKYFGDEDPIGKQLTFRLDNQIFDQFLIGAVLKKPQKNSSFQFSILVQQENILDAFAIQDDDWSSDFRSVLYVKLASNKDINQINTSIQKYVSTYNEIKDSWKIDELYLMPFKEQKNEARFVHAYTTAGGLPISALYGSIIMNGLILLIACFNFTNTSLVYANKRLREIGVRRTFGGYKWQIFKQFFTESFILCLIALILSVEFANAWIGMMNRQWPIEIAHYNYNIPSVSINLVILLLLVSLIAGAYPAYYASRFHPTEILKGKVKLIGSNNLSRVLLTWQFAFSVMAIFSGVVLSQNAMYQKTLDWGFNKDNSIVIPLGKDASYNAFKNKLTNYDHAKGISGTIQNLGYDAVGTEIELDGINHDTKMLFVGDNYLSNVGCELVSGRSFMEHSKYDITASVLVNEKFVESFKLKDPLQQKIYRDGKSYQIVGVVKDFMPYGLFAPISPVIIHLAPEENYSSLVLTTNEQHLSDLMQAAQTEWKMLYPNQPFEGFYMSENAAEAFNTNRGILVQFLINGFFALFLSITGLYSIVSLTISKRTKEIGVRKVFGATVAQVVKVINHEFAMILLIAIFIGCLGGYFFMDQFLSDIFTYYTKIGPISFFLASTVIFFMAAITSGFKVYKASMKNPADSLRWE